MPTRISGACNGCRAKKQKCSGDRSGCSQCAIAGIPCTWPEQRKRGPAKGYIEGLENRLHEAESLLLNLLPYVSQDQLQVATSNITQVQSSEHERASPDQRSSPPLLNKKTGIDYWENFPLDNAENVRRWQQDCEIHIRTDTMNTIPSNLRSDSHRSSPLHSNIRRPSTDHSCPIQQQSHRASTSRQNIPSPFILPSQNMVQMQGEPLQMLNTAAQQIELNDNLEGWMTNDYSQMQSQTSGHVQQGMNFQHFPHDPSWPSQESDVDINMIPVRKPDSGSTDTQHHHLFW